ncbi:MAG: hypothetical protein HQK74_01340 [Desulfamplus sp.]|nr:hypothetical protein [Desulfamplus sp.]
MAPHEKLITYIYTTIFLFLTITGFAQMPIFKRYHIADIPGLGWLAEFYTTHAMHYIFGAVLIGLVAYLLVEQIAAGKHEKRLTKSGYTKGVMLIGLIVTGGLMVFKNLSGNPYSPIIVSILDLTHLAFCMALLFYSTFTLITKKGWVRYPIKDIVTKRIF